MPVSVQATTPPATTAAAPTPPELLNISGSFDLFDDGKRWKVGQDCEGSGGYSDIHVGTQVIVTSNGEIVGKGVLLGGTARRKGTHVSCGYELLLLGVPAGRGFYKIEVGHRGGLVFTERELAEDLSLSLGED